MAESGKDMRYWARTLADAFRGRGGDLNREPLGRAILLLAVPMVLEQVMESIFAVVDIFFVARLGAEAMAAVGLTESMLYIVYTVAAGLSIGVTAVVARRIGERDDDGAGTAAVQALLLGLGIALVLGAAGLLSAPALLRLMGASEAVIRVGTGYALVMLGGNGVILLLYMMNAAFRGAGDAAVAMRVLWLANGLNIVLDPCLIFGLGPFPELGVTGAAVATTIGRGVGVAAQLAVLFRLSARLRARRRHLALRPAVMGRVLRLSGAGTLQTFIGTASWILLVRVVAGFGAAAVAGYTIGMRVVIFALLPAWGLANAAATLVGQALGAEQPDRAERAVGLAGRMNLAFLGSVGVVFLLCAGGIVALFGGDAETARHAVTCLRIVAGGFGFYAFGMVLTQAFNGAGDAWTPIWLNVLCFWLLEIPLAWTLAYPAGLGPAGAFTAIAVAYSVMAGASAVLFRRGTWRTARV